MAQTSFFVCVATFWALASATGQRQDAIVRGLNLNDFESGTLSPWLDESVADVRWTIEDVNSPVEADQPAPVPLSGQKYLRVSRPTAGSGTAVLRSSTFTAVPNDQFTLSFWIRSEIIQTNNLDIYWATATGQERILSLIQYSTPSNYEWREASAFIPVNEPTDGKIAIYGICGPNTRDAIAIDNLVVSSSTETTTPTTPGTGTTSSSTTSTTTAPTPPGCPTNLGPQQVPCVTLGSGCYCFSKVQVESWFAAETYCKSNGANLVSLETQGESDVFRNHITNPSSGLDAAGPYWTSGSYSGSAFIWTGSGQPLTYTNWYPGQPDNLQSGYCVRSFFGADYAGRWSDIVCSGQGYVPHYFVCEL